MKYILVLLILGIALIDVLFFLLNEFKNQRVEISLLSLQIMKYLLSLFLLMRHLISVLFEFLSEFLEILYSVI